MNWRVGKIFPWCEELYTSLATFLNNVCNANFSQYFDLV